MVWDEPANTGLGGSWGTWGFASSARVLEGYQVMPAPHTPNPTFVFLHK